MHEIARSLPRAEATARFGTAFYASRREVIAFLQPAIHGQTTSYPDETSVHATAERAAWELVQQYIRQVRLRLEHHHDVLTFGWPDLSTLRDRIIAFIAVGAPRSRALRRLAHVRRMQREIPKLCALIKQMTDDPLSHGRYGKPLDFVDLPETLYFDGLLPVGTPVYRLAVYFDSGAVTVRLIDERVEEMEIRSASKSDNTRYITFYRLTSDGSFRGNQLDPDNPCVARTGEQHYLYLDREAARAKAEDIVERTRKNLTAPA